MQQPTPPAARPEPPPAPAVETVKLTTGTESTSALKPSAAGQIEVIAAAGPVNAGDVVVRFVGHKPIETEVQGLERDIDKRVKPELAQAEKERDAAQTANNKAAVTTAEGRIADRKKSLEDKQGKLAAKKAELDKFVIRAPAAGTLTVKGKVGARVSPSDEVATIVIAPVRIAKFAKAPPVAPKARVLLVTTSDHKNISCVVASSDPGSVTVECPQDAVADGAEVSFGGPDTSAPPPSNTDVDATAGSAAAERPLRLHASRTRAPPGTGSCCGTCRSSSGMFSRRRRRRRRRRLTPPAGSASEGNSRSSSGPALLLPAPTNGRRTRPRLLGAASSR